MIGWYVHHQGRGHLHRARAVTAHLDEDVTVLSTLPREDWAADWLELPRDDVEGRTDASPGGRLHYAPVDNRGHTDRLAAIGAWVSQTRPRLVVVDVSVEVTALVRTLGVPVVVMAMPGDRDDAPHELGHDLARAIVAPWPGELYQPGYLRRRADKVTYAGGISRHAGRPAPAPAPATATAAASPATTADMADMAASASGSRTRRVLLLGGAGGSRLGPADLDAARAATPGWQWTVAGPLGEWHADVLPLLVSTDVAVIAAGQNSVADVAVAGCRAVVIAEDRPFDEQRATAGVLAQHGLAVVREAWPTDWAAVLDEAMALDPAWERWRADGAAARAAQAIQAAADGVVAR